MMRYTHARGFSLVELIVAIGLFAVVMTIATTAYLIMINANREAQAITTGTNNLSYALENMTRNIRIGRAYRCPTANSFTFDDISGVPTTYSWNNTGGTPAKHNIVRTVNGVTGDLTDRVIDIQSLVFTCGGVAPSAMNPTWTGGDDTQANVTIVVSGSLPVGPGKPAKTFNIETSATMRYNDLI